MNNPNLDVVTGAFSYTGKYIAGKLLSAGREVRALTGHPGNVNPFCDRVEPRPLRFDYPGELARSLQGAKALYNTYWIRYPRGELTFDAAVENTKILIRAAQQARVHRIVHISITNASLDSGLDYFRAKAQAEEAITGSGLAHSIIRPTLIFGAEDILTNNIAWFLRKSPVFPIPGSGEYLVQPVHVEDVAEAAVVSAEQDNNSVQDCIGPEIYTYRQFVRLIGDGIGVRTKVLPVPPGLVLLLSRIAGYMVGDAVLTRSEVEGLMAGQLVSPDPPTGQVSLSHWLAGHRDRLGNSYASEVRRYYR